MGKLTDDEAKMLAELEAKKNAPDDPEPDDDDDQDDDGHVIVLRGSKADAFLSSLFPSGKGKGKGKGEPEGKPDDDGKPDDGKPDDDDDDPEPKQQTHRFFR